MRWQLKWEDLMITIKLFPSTFLILFSLVFVVTIIIRVIRKKSYLKLFYVGIIELYVLLLVSVTLLPINIINPSLREGESRMIDYVQLIPFRTILETIESNGFLSIQLVGNIVLLLPLPILIGYVVKNKSFVILLAKCALISLGIEFIQICIDFAIQYPSRRFDVDDIILNVIGVMIGTMVFKTISHFETFYNWIGEKIVWKI